MQNKPCHWSFLFAVAGLAALGNLSLIGCGETPETPENAVAEGEKPPATSEQQTPPVAPAEKETDKSPESPVSEEKPEEGTGFRLPNLPDLSAPRNETSPEPNKEEPETATPVLKTAPETDDDPAKTTDTPTSEESEKFDESDASEPATVQAAMKVLDLRKLPKPAKAVTTQATPTQMSLTAPMNVAEAKAYYETLLTEAGWEPRKSDTTAPLTEEYGQLDFTKDGFNLGVSLSRIPDTGQTNIGLNNYGNLDAQALPAPEESERLFGNHMSVIYATAAKVPTVADACLTKLQESGWQVYTRPFTSYAEDENQRALSLKKNGVGLTVFVATAPAQKGRTTVQYSLNMLGDELPAPADATQIEFMESPLQLNCQTTEQIPEVLEFYRAALPKLGWQETGKAQQEAGEAIAVFQRSEGLPIVVKIERDGDEKITQIKVAEFEMPRELPDEKPAEVAIAKPVPQPDEDLPAVQGPAGGLPGLLPGLLTYEDWLKKNKYEASPTRLEQYAKEMEKLANEAANSPLEELTKTPVKLPIGIDKPEVPASEPKSTPPEKTPSAKTSVIPENHAAAIKAIEAAEGRTQTTDDGQLTFAELTGTEFGDEQMKLLAGMSEMTYLNLSFTNVTDAGVAVVKEMPNLEKLYLSGTKLTDEGLAAVANLKKLDLLLLNQTDVTDKGLARLKNLADLERLSLEETGITDVGLKELLAFPKLKSLSLANTKLTDDAIPQLVQLRNLEEIDLRGTEISPAALKVLQTALPECDIDQ